jgi:hypothetical protein
MSEPTPPKSADVVVNPLEVEVTVQGPGINVTKRVPLALGLTIVQAVLVGDWPHVAPSHSGVRTSGTTTAVDPELSLREALEASQARSIPEKITAAANFLRDYRHVAAVSADQLRSGLEEAGESPPGNFPRDLSHAVRAGWLAPKAGSSGLYYLTTKGEGAVKSNCPQSVSEAGARARKVRTKPKAAT